uniref:Ig-like domain-containing protein n=1 Tax=Globodera rostochiensis TaxID=31243 RepID=A0A914HUY7_GLORO
MAANDAKPSDPEKAAEENDRNDGRKLPKQNGRQLLLGPEEIERYRKNPLWKALRFALFGSLICLFFLLLVAAILIVALSSGCAVGGEIEGTATTIDLLLGEGGTERTQFAQEKPLNHQTLVSVPEDESAFFHCDYPSGKIRWHRIGQNAEELNQNKNIDLFDNGTLLIRNVKLSDQGEYICEGMSPLGQWHRLEDVKLELARPREEGGKQSIEGTAEEQQTQVPFESSTASESADPVLPSAVRPSPSPLVYPRVDSYLKLASTGEPVHFRCWMAGKSSEDLSWHKVKGAQRGAGAAGEGISLLATEPDGHSAFLIFGTVKESDAGDYECVEGRTGASSPTVRLRVEPSRTPVVEPREQSVAEHSPAQIACSVPGHPKAQLIWRRENGVEVKTLEGVTDDKKGTLQIAEVRREHERMGWVCWAIYTQRADKQALSSGGPAVIRVIQKAEESGGEKETTEKQRLEEGSGEEVGDTEEGEESEVGNGETEENSAIETKLKEKIEQGEAKEEEEEKKEEDKKKEEEEKEEQEDETTAENTEREEIAGDYGQEEKTEEERAEDGKESDEQPEQKQRKTEETQLDER